jgi:hypothetical protein
VACGIIWILTLVFVLRRFRQLDKDRWDEIEAGRE